METRFGLADFTYFLSKFRTKLLGDLDLLDKVAEMDLDCFQAGLATDMEDGGAEQRKALREKSEALGIELIGAGGGQPTAELFERELGAAAEMGASIVRHACALFRWHNPPAPPEQLEKALKAVEPKARELGITIAIENHQDYSCDELAGVMAAVDSPNIGVCLDTGNSMSMMEAPLRTAQTLAPYAHDVHLKEYVLLPCPAGFSMVGVTLGQGIVDNRAILDILRREAPADPLHVTLENPLERCSTPILSSAYVETFGDRSFGDFAPLTELIETSMEKYPDGITLPQEAGLSDEEIAAAEDEHNHDAVEYAREVLGL